MARFIHLGRLSLALVVLGAAAAPARGAPPPSLLVVELQAEAGLENSVARLLNELALTELQRPGVFRVTGGSDLRAMITNEQHRQLLGCSDVTCLVEIAGALDSDLLAVTSVGRVGSQWLVNAKLIDVRGAAVAARVTHKCATEDDALVATFEAALRELIAASGFAPASGAGGPVGSVTTTTQEPRPPWGWVGLGAATVGAGAGVALLVAARGEADIERREYAAYLAAPTDARYAAVTRAVERANTTRLAGWSLAAAGLVGAGVATFFLVRDGEARVTVAAQPLAGAGVLVTAQGGF